MNKAEIIDFEDFGKDTSGRNISRKNPRTLNPDTVSLEEVASAFSAPHVGSLSPEEILIIREKEGDVVEEGEPVQERSSITLNNVGLEEDTIITDKPLISGDNELVSAGISKPTNKENEIIEPKVRVSDSSKKNDRDFFPRSNKPKRTTFKGGKTIRGNPELK